MINTFPIERAKKIPSDIDVREYIDKILIHEKIIEMLDTLSEREKKVLIERYFNNKTLAEIGKILGIGRPRVAQIEAKVLRKLRHPKRSDELLKAIDYERYLEVKKQRIESKIREQKEYERQWAIRKAELEEYRKQWIVQQVKNQSVVVALPIHEIPLPNEECIYNWVRQMKPM